MNTSALSVMPGARCCKGLVRVVRLFPVRNVLVWGLISFCRAAQDRLQVLQFRALPEPLVVPLDARLLATALRETHKTAKRAVSPSELSLPTHQYW